jgi:streptogramin lyase
VTLEADGQVLMTDSRNRALVRVDPQTGDRMIFSGCTTLDCSAPIGVGPPFSQLRMLALESSGDALVTTTQRSVFRVEAVSGDRMILSGCSDAACSSVIGAGPEFAVPYGIAVESSGDILVIDASLKSVLRVDPTSGDRTVISGCIDEFCVSTVGSGVDLEFPVEVVVEADGSILVTEASSFQGEPFRALFRVDPTSGDRTILSGCDRLGCASFFIVGAGTNFSIPIGLALGGSGEILVADYGMGAIFRVDPISGDRIVFSGCVDPSCSSSIGSGPSFAVPIGLTVVPEPRQLLALAVGACALALMRRLSRRE